MRKTAFVVSLLIVSVLLSGCIVVSSNKTQAPPKAKESAKAPCSESPQVRATLAEINAASKLMSESAKANVYRAIAQRPGLSPEERIHLTNAVTKHLMSESDKEEILLTLVNNYPPPPPPQRMPAVKCPPKPSGCSAAKMPKEAPKEPATEK
jgi:hypothetical protein